MLAPGFGLGAAQFRAVHDLVARKRARGTALAVAIVSGLASRW